MPQEGSLQVPLSAGRLHVSQALEAVFVEALTEEFERGLESRNTSHFTFFSFLGVCFALFCFVLVFNTKCSVIWGDFIFYILVTFSS